MTNQRILIIEDDQHIQELLKYNMEKSGYKVVLKENGMEGLKEAMTAEYDIILLDIMLPGIDGLDVCRRLKSEKRTRKIPILMLTARSEEIDKILGLELGADDYITKPFSIKELIARVRVALRRSTEENETDMNEQTSNNVLKFKDIEIDNEKHEVRKNNEKIVLTLKEFELLKMLIENKGKVLTRDLLLDKIWGYDYIGETRTVDVHIRHLRKKIEGDEESAQLIETIRGVGYKINIGE